MMEICTHPLVYSSQDVQCDRYMCVCVCARVLYPRYICTGENTECALCTKLRAALVFKLKHKHLETLINVYASTLSYVVKNKCQSSLFQTCIDSMCVSLTHSCIPALQQRFGVPEQQSVIWIHDVGLVLGLFFFVLRVRLVESLVIVLIEHSTLKQFTEQMLTIYLMQGGKYSQML